MDGDGCDALMMVLRLERGLLRAALRGSHTAAKRENHQTWKWKATLALRQSFAATDAGMRPTLNWLFWSENPLSRARLTRCMGRLNIDHVTWNRNLHKTQRYEEGSERVRRPREKTSKNILGLWVLQWAADLSCKMRAVSKAYAVRWKPIPARTKPLSNSSNGATNAKLPTSIDILCSPALTRRC